MKHRWTHLVIFSVCFPLQECLAAETKLPAHTKLFTVEPIIQKVYQILSHSINEEKIINTFSILEILKYQDLLQTPKTLKGQKIHEAKNFVTNLRN